MIVWPTSAPWALGATAAYAVMHREVAAPRRTWSRNIVFPQFLLPGCAAMAFLSIACSIFNIWADIQRMRAKTFGLDRSIEFVFAGAMQKEKMFLFLIPSFFSTVLRFNIRIRVSIQGLLPVTVRVRLTWPHEMYVILFTFNIIYDHHIAYIYIYIFNYCAKHWSEKNFTEWACRDHSSTGKMHRGGNLPRNDHNCIKAVAIAAPLLFHQRTLLGGQIWWLDIHLMACERSTDHWAEVSNILGALQLMLAVSIFQSLCVAEFPLEDSDQTFRSKD